MMKNKNRLLIVFASVLITSTGILLARQKTDGHQDKPADKKGVSEQTIHEINDVLLKLDTTRNLFLKGQYELYDSDSHQLLESEPFVFAKHDNELYIQVGYTEQLFKKSGMILIDNNEKTIWISQNGDNTEKPVFKGLDAIREFLKAPNAAIEEKKDGIIHSISLNMDSMGVCRWGKIEYEAGTNRLKSSGVVTQMIIPGNENNDLRKVLLQLVVQTYDEHGVIGETTKLNNKVLWDNSKIIVNDTLKQYSFHK